MFEAGTHPLEEEWVALDLETTGLSPEDDEIIEIAAIRFRGEETLDTFHSLVNPNRELGAFIRRYTGISQEEVDASPPFSRVAGRLESFVGGLPVVGHNVDFDLGFLAARGVRFPGPRADTLELAYVLKPSWEYSLEKVAAALGVSHDSPHRALGDAEVTRQVFNLLVEEAGRLDEYSLAEMQRLGSRSSWVLAYLLRRLETHRMLEGRPSPPATDTERRAQASVTGIDVASLRGRLQRSRALIPNQVPQPVEVGQVKAMLSRGGPVSQAMAGYEERAEQAAMAEAVARTINDGGRLIVEAGTGVGKSMAYLLPAALYALKNNVRVVVSTNTINLQEQLLSKDVPAVAEALRGVDGVPVEDFRYSLLKGRNNYLCLKRWSSLRSSESVSSDEARMLSKLLVWMQTTGTGDRSELNLSGGGWTPWDRVSAQGALDCNGVSGVCFLRHARDKAAAAHVVIVNHALLVTDILTGGAAIPEHDVLIVDEAQHLEGVATDHMGFQIGQAGLEDHLDLLAGERGLLNRAVLALRGSSAAQTRRDSLDEAAQRNIAALPPVREGVAKLFGVLQRLLPAASGAQSRFGQELRVTSSTRGQPAWSEAEIAWEDADAALAELDSAISDLLTSLDGLEDAGVLDYEALVMETIGLRERTREIRSRLREAVPHPEENGIYWLSRSPRSGDLEVNMAPVHVGDLLEKLVYSQRRAVVLTSATLSTRAGFGHIIERTGFAEADELRLGSPFDYPKAALLCVPNDMPEPSAWDYQAAVEQAVMDAALAAGGATMALFTSHASLQSTSRALKGSLEAQGFEVLAQGVDGTPHQLVRRFVENPKSVLLGTASFWEGVDLAGDALKVLLVARLPFSVPTDPVFSARSELYERAFDEYAVPQAILRLRQGFGRLIRTNRDRGVAVILDKRAVSRRYGRSFLDSLPPATRRTPALYELPGEIRRWLGTQ